MLGHIAVFIYGMDMFRLGESRKGHMADALALVGDERRGKLR